MSHQRRRGFPVTIYPEKTTYDLDGVETKVPDFGNPVTVRGTEYPQRSQRAEVPGQLEVNVIRIIVDTLPNVGPWARCSFWGKEWDVVAPPMDRGHTLARQVKHMSVDVRERPANID